MHSMFSWEKGVGVEGVVSQGLYCLFRIIGRVKKTNVGHIGFTDPVVAFISIPPLFYYFILLKNYSICFVDYSIVYMLKRTLFKYHRSLSITSAIRKLYRGVALSLTPVTTSY